MQNIPGSEPQGFDIIQALRRQWYVPLITAVLGVLGAWLLSFTIKGEYEARSTVQLSPIKGEEAPGGGRERTVNVETQATVARATEIMEALAKTLNSTPVAVKRASKAVAAPTGDIMYFFFKAEDAGAAAEGATRYAEEFLNNRRDLGLGRIDSVRQLLVSQIGDQEKELAAISTLVSTLRARPDSATTRAELEIAQRQQEFGFRQLSELRSGLAGLRSDVEPGRIIVSPRPPSQRTGTSATLSLIGGLIAGALAGVFLALLRDRRDDRYSIVDQSMIDLKELARIDSAPASVLRRATHDNVARQQHLRLLLRLEALAESESQYGDVVLLVPVENRTLPQTAARNLVESLTAEAELNGRQVSLYRTALRNEADYDTDRWMQHSVAVRQLRVHKDLVLIEVDSLSNSSDALAMANLADLVLLLISDATAMTDIRKAQRELEALGARIGGVVTISRASLRGASDQAVPTVAVSSSPVTELPRRHQQTNALPAARPTRLARQRDDNDSRFVHTDD